MTLLSSSKVVENFSTGSLSPVKEDCETNYKGIFVAGDVRSKKVRQLTTATSDGTIACLNAISYIDNK